MKNIFFVFFLFLGSLASAENESLPGFEEFLNAWGEKVQNLKNRKEPILRQEDPHAQYIDQIKHRNVPGVPREIEVFSGTPEAHAFYELLAVFNSEERNKFNTQEIKQHALALCGTLSEDEAEMDTCAAQILKHRESLCKATPLVARDACADVLQQIFSPESV